MIKVIGRAGNVASTSTSRGKDWTYLSNLTNVDGYVAQCNNITSKTGANNRPSKITLSNYNFKFPTNAFIIKLVIRWKDRFTSNLTDINNTKFPSFLETTFSFNGCTLKPVVGSPPAINFVEKKIELVNPTITAEELLSDEFGVNVEYSFNNSDNVGGIYLDYVKVDIEYEIPQFNVSITEPRHRGAVRTWSTEDDPTILKIGDICQTTVKVRTLNSYESGVKTVRINVPINYKLLDITPHEGELIVYEDTTYVDWVVNPPLGNIGEMGENANCDIKFTPRAFNSTEMISATLLETGQSAKYYISVLTELDYVNDVSIVTSQLRRMMHEDDFGTQFTLGINISPIDKEDFIEQGMIFPVQIKLWSVADNEYVPFNLDLFNVTTSNKMINPEMAKNQDNKTYFLDLEWNDMNSFDGKILTGVYLNFLDFRGDAGEYEFRVFVPHDRSLSTFDVYSQNIYIDEAVHWEFNCRAEKWKVNTCNVASTDGTGYSFNCKTANGFQYKTKMDGSQTILEPRIRHIGKMRIPKSHYEPKLKFSNKVNEGSYKNRSYFNKSGQWEHDLSLNIYLPKFYWKTLQEFVKMDKPVSIDTCPTCSDDDVLNHRGFVEIEDISNVERVNGTWYKGEIGVKRITDKYFGKASIVKGASVCSARIPYTFMNTIRNGEFYLNYFDMYGGGQLIYDKDNNIINQIIVPTGETLHLRSKWASKDIDDYLFSWNSSLPSEPTDESNDYKYNSIVYKVMDNLTGQTVLTYTLYDFTTFNEVGTVVNTCKVSCTRFDRDNNPTLLFTKQIRLDYEDTAPTTFYSTTRFQFNASLLTITESGLSGQELVQRDINLPSGEYLLDIAVANNDVGLLEPDFIVYLNMDLKENILANPLSNFYADILISPFVIPTLKLLFYRYTEDGVLYYYYGDTSATYLVDGYQQYKGGVDLQTATGSSILYIDNLQQTLYLNNGLTKVGFDRSFGTISFYTYDARQREFVYVSSVKIDDWADFEILMLTDDKAMIQFGETIWSMWRGHPFVQCEHINTDLIINDVEGGSEGLVHEYNTINCEGLITSDGKVVYDGVHGKKEQYLYDAIVNPIVMIEGINVPSFITGDTVILKAYCEDYYGEWLGTTSTDNEGNLLDVNKIGKMQFTVDGVGSFIDPTPTADANGKYYWQVTFQVNEEGNFPLTATLLPKGEFTESSSTGHRISVRKLDSVLYPCTDGGLAYTLGTYSKNAVVSDETATIKYVLYHGTNNVGSGKAIKIYEETLGLVDTVYTDSNGIATYTLDLEEERVYTFSATFEGDTTYYPSVGDNYVLNVRDDTKTDVTLTDNISVGENGVVTLSFGGVATGNIKVTVNDKDYKFGISSTKNIQVPNVGTYDYYAEYQGTQVYNKAVLQGSFTVSKAETDIGSTISPTSINLGEEVTVSVSSNSLQSVSCVLYDNDSPVLTKTLNGSSVTFNYKPTYAGTHQLKVGYNGTKWTSASMSLATTVTVANSPTVLAHANGDVYRTSVDYVRLTDWDSNGLANKQVKYTVNGVTYNKTTDSDGYMQININLNEGQYPVHVAFLGDNGYQASTVDYTLTVKPFETVWKRANSLMSSHDSRLAPYQPWTDIYFDGVNGNNYATCGNTTVMDYIIQSKNGVYHTADQLALYNYGFNIPSNAVIKELRVRVYEKQYDPRSDSMPNIGNAVVSIQNNGSRTCQTQPNKSKTSFNINEVTWTSPNVTVQQVNDSSFTVFLNHGMNDSGNTGALFLKYFEVAIVYSIPTVRS